MTWYVIDTRYDRIVNAIASTKRPSLENFPHSEHLRATLNPPLDLLEQYEYWRRRS